MKRLFFELRYLLGSAPWDTRISPPELLAYLDRHSAGRALELGCGTGTNALTMVERGWEVTAIDFSSGALRTARRRFARAGKPVILVRGDVAMMAAASGIYELVLDIGCFHSLEPEWRTAYAHNLRRHVGPGTTYLLYSFLSEGQPGRTRWPTRSEVETLFGVYLQECTVATGADHLRPSAWFTFEAGEP